MSVHYLYMSIRENRFLTLPLEILYEVPTIVTYKIQIACSLAMPNSGEMQPTVLPCELKNVTVIGFNPLPCILKALQLGRQGQTSNHRWALGYFGLFLPPPP